MSVWVMTKPPSAVGAERTSRMLPSGMSRRYSCGRLRSSASSAASRAAASGSGPKAPAARCACSSAASGRPGTMSAGARLL